MRTGGADFLQKNAAMADEVRRTLVDLDEVEKELKKAAKAIDATTGLAGKYRVQAAGSLRQRGAEETAAAPPRTAAASLKQATSLPESARPGGDFEGVGSIVR
jgi:hypothetical protein